MRAGYTWQHFLFYATAGGAVGDDSSNITLNQSTLVWQSCRDFRLSDSNGGTHNSTAPLGWTAGTGIEYLFNDAISAKVEYLYVNLGRVSCPAGTLCNIDNIALSDRSVSFTENLIRAGINYKFSW